MTADICILTPDASYPREWDGDAALFRALFGQRLEFRCWSDAGDLSRFGMILPLLAWGYQFASSDWFRALDVWEAAELPFANPIPLLRWNTDKDYLLDLAERGLPVVPTIEVHGLTGDALSEAREAFGVDDVIVKPSISGGADRTYRLCTGDPVPFDVLEREMLVQPLIPAIAGEGEYSLFLFDGTLSHCVLKTPKGGDFRVQEHLGGTSRTVEAPPAALALAHGMLASLPEIPLYARVDMVRDGDGSFLLMELEAIEPSLFLSHAPDGGAMFATAVTRRV